LRAEAALRRFNKQPAVEKVEEESESETESEEEEEITVK
jgi:hypothetical protein